MSKRIKIAVVILLAIITALTIYIKVTNNTSLKSTETVDSKEIVNILETQIKELSNKPVYIQLEIDEGNSIGYIYNSKGEVYTQDKDFTTTEFIRNDKIGFSFNNKTGDMLKGEDADILGILRCGVDSMKGRELSVYKTDKDNTTGYILELKDAEIKELYKDLSKDFQDKMYNSVKKTFKDGWTPYIKLVYFIRDNKFSGAAMLYRVKNNDVLNWQMLGYADIEDWRAPQGFYSLDSEKDKDGTEFKKLYEELMLEIDRITINLAKRLGMDNSTGSAITSGGAIENNTEIQYDDRLTIENDNGTVRIKDNKTGLEVETINYNVASNLEEDNEEQYKIKLLGTKGNEDIYLIIRKDTGVVSIDGGKTEAIRIYNSIGKDWKNIYEDGENKVMVKIK